jgi:hypothetical protein
MLSGLITTNQNAHSAVTIPITGALTKRHDSLRDVVKVGVYQRGLTNVANKINVGVGNLSNQLDGQHRCFSVDKLEEYIAKTGDVTPIHYLIERFIANNNAEQMTALAQAAVLIQQLQPLLSAAGVRNV